MTSKTSIKPPWPTKILELILCFDISSLLGGTNLSMSDHEKAVERALASVSSQLRPDGAVIVKVHIEPGNTTAPEMMKLAKHLPKDDWNACGRILPDGRPVAIRLELVYSANRRMAVRILTELPRSDGVSAIRVALHVLDELENASAESIDQVLLTQSAASKFKSNPPFVWGLRHTWNNITRVSKVLMQANWPFATQISEKEKVVPTSVAGLRHYFQDPERASSPAVYKLYRAIPDPSLPPSSSYKQFVKSIGKWHNQAGFQGYFNLNNFSNNKDPASVAVSIVPRAEDLFDYKARYANVFVPPGPFPFGSIWDVLNLVHAQVLFSNNYGVHKHSFVAVPEAFSWDWLGMMAPVPGAGVISINGVTMVWTRWTKEGQKEIEGLFEEALGPALLDWHQSPKCLEASSV